MVRRNYNAALLVFSVLLLLFIFTFSLKAMEPVDIADHWAQDYILNVVNRDIMELDYDNRFEPERKITRGEFTRALGRQMNLEPVYSSRFADLEGYPGREKVNALLEKEIMNGYPDDTFRPEREISRAEAVSILIRVLGVLDNEQLIELNDHNPYSDIDSNHWAVHEIKIADWLGLLNDDEENFNPAEYITRAEAARFLSQLNALDGQSGYITDVYPASEKVSINLLSGERAIYDLREDTLIGRNNRLVEIDEIQSTDKVFLITDSEKEELKYVKGYGMVTQDDMAAEISTMTDGVLDMEEVKTLSSGELEFLRPKLIEEVKEQMTAQGLSEKEVEAIISTNWNELEDLSRDRLSEAVAIQTGLPLDITESILEGDWQRIRSYAQIELIQRVVQEVLNSELIS